MTYRFIEDSGHGWLEVPVAELHALGIARDISPYSYRRGELAYLEEDCDMSMFFGAKRARGEPVPYVTVYQDVSPIRGYARWH